MSEHSLDLGNLLWFAGWLVAVGALLVAGLAIPLQTRSRRGWMFAVAVVAAAVAVTVIANVALVLHDNHIDLTREKVFTPSGQAMRVVDQPAAGGQAHLLLPLSGSGRPAHQGHPRDHGTPQSAAQGDHSRP